ncbi:unnamed protein product, partial [Ectocarpus sp. 13 AM-2016]
MHRLLKKLLVSQSTTVGPERSDRELAYMFKWYNDNIDVRRGIRKPDFMWGRTWSETRAKALWTSIDGPSPGGNQRMPRGLTADGGPAQAGLWNGGKELFGHEYFSTFTDHNIEECAKLAGVEIDLLKKTFLVRPVEAFDDEPTLDDFFGDPDEEMPSPATPTVPVATPPPATAIASVFVPSAPPFVVNSTAVSTLATLGPSSSSNPSDGAQGAGTGGRLVVAGVSGTTNAGPAPAGASGGAGGAGGAGAGASG